MGVIMYNGIQYTGAGGGSSDVTPNPEGSATDILKKLEIEDTIYGISNTVELTQAEYDDLPSSKLTDNILYIIKDAAGASGGNNKTLSGTVAPTAALGDNGDEYIQYHLSSNTPVIDAKYTKVRGQWIAYQDDSTIVVPAVHYTTDEQVVGTWIDGRPIYMKCFQLSNYQLVRSAWTTINDVEVPNIDDVVEITVSGYDTDNQYPALGGLLSMRFNGNKLQYFLNIDFPIYVKTIILRYTKTTD